MLIFRRLCVIIIGVVAEYLMLHNQCSICLPNRDLLRLQYDFHE